MASTSRWKKFGIILYLFAVHLLALFFVLEKLRGGEEEEALPPAVAADTVRAPGPLRYGDNGADTSILMIPVAGVRREDLQDTYTQSRSGGRVHNAIDIMAPEGTPVVAVTDGEIAKFFESRQGGTTIYQWGADRKRVYYYAHLQRRADGITEHQFVKRGTIIGYVGNTGNAGPDNYHLHFSIIIPSDSTRHWEGTDINPYPVLANGIEIPLTWP